MVIEKYKSGFLPPDDFPFEDLSTIRSGSVGSDSSSNGTGSGLGTGTHSTVSLSSSSGLKSETKSGTMSALKLKKRAGLFGIFNAGKVKSFFNIFSCHSLRKQFLKPIVVVTFTNIRISLYFKKINCLINHLLKQFALTSIQLK